MNPVSLPDSSFVHHEPLEGHPCTINSLPPELLLRIFRFGLSNGEREDTITPLYLEWMNSDRINLARFGPQGYPDHDSFPILVSHVCRYWRNLAISTPSFWAAISLAVPATGSNGGSFNRVLSVIERSKDLSIDVLWSSAQPNPQWHSLLSPHAHRCHSLRIEFMLHSDMLAFLDIASQTTVPTAAKLTTLKLHHGFCKKLRLGGVDIQHFKPLFGGSAPLLETVSLWGVPIDWDQPWISSAPNLTSLELADHPENLRPSCAQFITILRGAPRLKKLTLHFSGPSGDPLAEDWMDAGVGDPDASIPLLNLTHFSFKDDSRNRTFYLLRKLHMPSLESLAVAQGAQHGFSTFSLDEPIFSLVLDSVNRLHTFKIGFFLIPKQDVRRLYIQLQNLKSLHIPAYEPDKRQHFTRMFLAFLRPFASDTTGEAVLLPSLENLFVSVVPADLCVVREVVQTRRDAGHPLKSLHLECFDLVDDDTKEEDEDVRWLKDNVGEFTFSGIVDIMIGSDCIDTRVARGRLQIYPCA